MRVFVAAFIVVVSVSLAQAERRVALVFGADRYEHIRPLTNAVNDARAVEDALDALGFEVFSETNRSLKRMRRALEDFAEDAAGADVAFVFFAGHGVEIAGQNRLLPTDASTASLEVLKNSSLPLEELRETVSKVAKIGLIVLDACRDDPFATVSDPKGRGVSALGLPKTIKPGLGRMGRAENTLFAFAAAPGETADDGEGQNSPFTTALTKYLGTEGLEIRSVLTLVQQEVYDRSRGNQLPYVESGLPSLFFASETTDELPERERLLLAMADVSPQMRQDVESIATDAQMPLAPLYGALIGSDIASLNREERGNKLREAAEAFTKVRDELRSLRSGDDRVTALRQQAEEQLSLGAFDAARTRLTEAANIDATSRETLKTNLIERTLSEAATHYLNGGAARSELKYRLAIADYEKAEQLFAEVEDEDIPADDRHQHILTLEALGGIRSTVGDLTGAELAYDAMLVLTKRRAESDRSRLSWQHDHSAVYRKLGDLRLEKLDFMGAQSAFEAALAISEKVVAADPSNNAWQRNFFNSKASIGQLYTYNGEYDKALAAYEASLVIAERASANYPNDTEWQRGISNMHLSIGVVRELGGDLDGAMRAYKASKPHAERLVANDASVLHWQQDLLKIHLGIGGIFLEQGDYAEALVEYTDSLAIAKYITSADPSNVSWQLNLSASHDGRGRALFSMGEFEDASDALRAGFDIVQKRVTAEPANVMLRVHLFEAHTAIGEVRKATEDFDGALAAFDAARKVSETLVALAPEITEVQGFLSNSHSSIGDIYVRQGKLSDAGAAFHRGVKIKERLAAADPANTDLQWSLYTGYWRIAKYTEEKELYYGKAIKLLEKLHDQGRLDSDQIEWIEITKNKLREVQSED